MRDVRGKRGFYWFNGSLYFTFEKVFGVFGRNNRMSGEPFGFCVTVMDAPKSMTEPGRFRNVPKPGWSFGVGFYRRGLKWLQ